jgi:hypothetical protein
MKEKGEPVEKATLVPAARTGHHLLDAAGYLSLGPSKWRTRTWLSRSGLGRFPGYVAFGDCRSRLGRSRLGRSGLGRSGLGRSRLSRCTPQHCSTRSKTSKDQSSKSRFLSHRYVCISAVNVR